MVRNSSCYEQKLRKGLWSPEEDEKLVRHITQYGHGCWSSVPKLAGLQRCGKSCRLRWINYLKPDLKRGAFSEEEENLIIELHANMGNRWSQIAAHLPGRTDNEIKNLWNSCIKKQLKQRGIDPSTHKPLSGAKAALGEDGKATSNGDETASAASNKLKLLAASASGNSNPAAAPSVPALPLVPLDDDPGAAKCPATPTKDFFPDRFVPESFSSSCPPCNSVGDFHLKQLYYGSGYQLNASAGVSTNLNSLLWLNQNCRPFDVTPEFNCETASDAVPSASTSILSTSPTGLKSMANLPPDNPTQGGSAGVINGAQLWEAGTSSNSSGSSGNSGSIDQLQSNSSFFDSSLLPWPELALDKQAAFLIGAESEDLKWSEYLHSPFHAIQRQSQGLYSEVKAESQFAIEGLSAWQESQQQQQLLQASDMSGKDLQRISEAFGQI